MKNKLNNCDAKKNINYIKRYEQKKIMKEKKSKWNQLNCKIFIFMTAVSDERINVYLNEGRFVLMFWTFVTCTKCVYSFTFQCATIWLIKHKCSYVERWIEIHSNDLPKKKIVSKILLWIASKLYRRPISSLKQTDKKKTYTWTNKYTDAYFQATR